MRMGMQKGRRPMGGRTQRRMPLRGTRRLPRRPLRERREPEKREEPLPEPDPEWDRIVVPGEEIVDDVNVLAGHGTYRVGSRVYSKYVGVVEKRGSVISVIPLAGKYIPEVGDYVIGEVAQVSFSTWKVDIGASYDAILPLTEVKEFIERGEDLAKYYKRGTIILARVDKVTQDMNIQLSMKDRRSRRLVGGRIVDITPSKVPRLIGRNGTMINTIKQKTGCHIIVGQNGRVWISGEHEEVAARAIELVNRHAHEKGLTDRVTQFIEEELEKLGVTVPSEEKEESPAPEEGESGETTEAPEQAGGETESPQEQEAEEEKKEEQVVEQAAEPRETYEEGE